MKLGVYTAILHDRALPDALDVIADLGLGGAEINAGGFLPPVHIPIDDVINSQAARDDYLAIFADRGVELAGLNVNGNPLHPDPQYGPGHAADLERAIRAAGALGQTRVVTMSGLPGAEPGATRPNWGVNPWNTGVLDIVEHGWREAIPFWKRITGLAEDHGVKIAIEMHPHNLVFNAPTMIRLAEQVGSPAIGAELDPSHLFWQQMDPIAVVRHLGGLVFHAAAKDVRINEFARIAGVLDDRFSAPPEADRVPIGGPDALSVWPAESAWDFVALGRGHDADFWADFLAALAEVDPAMAVNIEHEDTSLGKVEGLRVAAETLLAAEQATRRTR